jgi:hypothetical protein
LIAGEKDFFMNRIALSLGLSVTLLLCGGCNKAKRDSNEVRAGIMKHLAGMNGLNMSAMDMEIHSITVNGDTAHAEVEYKLKTGNDKGAGMQLSYNLERRNGEWVVQKSQPIGGMIQHPDSNQNPHPNQTGTTGNMPNFGDILKSTGAPSQGNLPAGHVPINSTAAPSQPQGQAQPPTQKP